MNICLDCFNRTGDTNDYRFYNKRDVLYVKLTENPMKCSICGSIKPVISNAVKRFLDPWHGNPPEGWIRIENMPLNEDDENGSINPSEGG